MREDVRTDGDQDEAPDDQPFEQGDVSDRDERVVHGFDQDGSEQRTDDRAATVFSCKQHLQAPVQRFEIPVRGDGSLARRQEGTGPESIIADCRLKMLERYCALRVFCCSSQLQSKETHSAFRLARTGSKLWRRNDDGLCPV